MTVQEWYKENKHAYALENIQFGLPSGRYLGNALTASECVFAAEVWDTETYFQNGERKVFVRVKNI